MKNCGFTSKVTEDVYQHYTNQLDFKPAIGKYWFHVPNTRLMISTIMNNQQQICITTSKSVHLSLDENCILEIDERGIS